MTDNIIKIGITYKMIRGKEQNEVAETFISLPVSKRRFRELTVCTDKDSAVWQSVREALNTLTYLQGYDKLGSWVVCLEELS